jgi:GntR family transcriptional regulator, transcriptional repressor for pyruvate dehydrogenase complex
MSAAGATLIRLPQRIRLREQLVLHLAHEIISGRLAAGEPLPSEPELAREFGISKVVLRETIQELASCGLLRVQHGKRTTVLQQSDWNVLAGPVQEAYRLSGNADDLTRQLYDVRLVLELSAVALAAEHSSRDHLSELDGLVDAMREIARKARDVPAFLVSDRAFHDVIGRATGNMVLRAMMRDLHNLLAANWTGSRTSPAQLESLAQQHADIAEAIRTRDSAAAAAAMETHLLWAKSVETARGDANSAGRRPRSRDGFPSISTERISGARHR